MVQTDSKNKGLSMDFLLDGGLIPSLPISGGQVGHQELIGMGLVGKPPMIPRANVKSPPQPFYGLPYAHNNVLSNKLPEIKPGQPFRYTSNVNACNSNNTLKSQSMNGNGINGRLGHNKNHSLSSTHSTSSQKSQNELMYERPPLLRRTSSFNQLPPNSALSSSSQSINSVVKHSNQQHRNSHGSSKLRYSTSDSAVHTHTRSKSIPRTDIESIGIEIGNEEDDEMINCILIILKSLIPKDRLSDPDSSSADDFIGRILDPMHLLIPCSIILEALVKERTLLKEDYGHGYNLKEESSDNEHYYNDTKESLILSNGIQLILYLDDGEINWLVLNWYIQTFSQILNALLPFLKRLQLEPQRSSSPKGKEKENDKEQETLEDMIRSLRVYISKMKKVFGEIALLYVDKYSFIRGFWIENDLKDSAGQVGKWSEMFD
ncbi:uncharacterized protein L201_006867 [Kwoniella dendrophila CBS 6074]|uniref:Uncharacterized protein n=1 Tax=Kwoniella dendrophila CBS 6074 TaxID=1295534 RepID=A0AAX4K2S0_9TREE